MLYLAFTLYAIESIINWYLLYLYSLILINMARLQYTIEDEIKNKAESFLQGQGIPPAVGITMFYIEVINNGGLPFVPSKVPNKRTLAAFEESEKSIDLIGYDNPSDLLKALKND